MIFCLTNVYNGMDGLERMWASVRRFYPDSELICIDGKYPDYPGTNEVSTDGTRIWVREHGHLIDCIDYEVEKRNAGLRYIDSEASDGDWVLVLDHDEELASVTSWPKRVGYFSFTRMTPRRVEYGRCRLYAWEPGLEFRHRHYDLYSGDELVASLEDAPDYQCVGAGNHYETFPRPKAKQDYYQRLREREGSPWAHAS